MEIGEAQGLLSAALAHFLEHELPQSRRLLIALKEIEALGYDVVVVPEPRVEIKRRDLATIGSIARHRAKVAKLERHFRKKLAQ